MARIVCRIAETRKELDDALRIRHEVFAQELANLDPTRHVVPREVDPFDSPLSTIHFVAYMDGAAVGAARMILPNPDIARAMGTLYGFDIETKFDLTNLALVQGKPAETMRYCVVAQARNTPVAATMLREGVRFSKELGITHWIGSATIDTNTPEQAARIAAIGANLGLLHPNVRITPRYESCPWTTPQQTWLAGSNCPVSYAPPCNDAVPRILALYLRRLGARIVGPPAYDTRFRGYSMPILMAVADQRVRDDHPPPVLPSPPLAA